jgi:hypothetical protein
MWTWLRRLLGLESARTLSVDQAIEIAKKECERRGWPWGEPLEIREGRNDVFIGTNYGVMGGNVGITISLIDGSVKSAGFAPR